MQLNVGTARADAAQCWDYPSGCSSMLGPLDQMQLNAGTALVDAALGLLGNIDFTEGENPSKVTVEPVAHAHLL
ncbi:hypothetical protein HDV02_002962 [Globomyces sp. JEL0801]|nr:hypothetical protein HDV02_002962 [Globomyces sp. JEL0801]